MIEGIEAFRKGNQFHFRQNHMKTMNKQKTATFLMMALFTIVLLSGCANAESVDACLEGKTYGFLWGLWHGVIAPIDLVLMLFRDDIVVFAQNNNGFWYALGFVIGSGGWGILGGKQLGGKRKD
jgi:hypothetical protein